MNKSYIKQNLFSMTKSELSGLRHLQKMKRLKLCWHSSSIQSANSTLSIPNLPNVSCRGNRGLIAFQSTIITVLISIPNCRAGVLGCWSSECLCVPSWLMCVCPAERLTSSSAGNSGDAALLCENNHTLILAAFHLQEVPHYYMVVWGHQTKLSNQ